MESRGPCFFDIAGTTAENVSNMSYFLYKQDIARLAAIGIPHYSFYGYDAFTNILIQHAGAPQYLRQQLGYIWNTFRPRSILITEFGFPIHGEADSDERDIDDERYDLDRALYIQNFLAEMLKSWSVGRCLWIITSLGHKMTILGCRVLTGRMGRIRGGIRGVSIFDLWTISRGMR